MDEQIRLARNARYRERYAADPEYRDRRLRTRKTESHKRWVAANPEKNRAIARRHKENLRAAALAAYGGKCACCGETEDVFLVIDHVNDDGAEHRKTVKGGVPMYRWLRNHDYPPEYQVLCCNCNWAKWRGGCPHQRVA